VAAVAEPQPGLDHLDDLVARVRDPGVSVDLTVEGTHDRPLPDGVDLSAYRIVQEALTNVLKHSGSSTASVRIAYRPDALEIEVADRGIGVPEGAASDGGHGLIGMRERTALFGGSFESGARADGGFVVRARLPLEVAAT